MAASPPLPPVAFPSAPADLPHHRGQRAGLVRQLRTRGIHDERVLDALNVVPRHLFFAPGFAGWAYDDKAFPIGHEQTISQPYTVAYQTQILRTLPGQRVLEIGTGSGYQCAILVALGLEVYTVELVPALYEQARRRFAELGVAPHCFLGDGGAGLPTLAPFDRILLTAAAPAIPAPLLRQLAVGGVLVAPIGPPDEVQQMVRVIRETSRDFRRETLGDFRFVPLRPGDYQSPAEPNQVPGS